MNIEQMAVDACHRGDIDSLKSLIRNGLDLAFIEISLAIQASMAGQLDVIKFFAEEGINIRQKEGKLLGWAARNGHLHVLRWLQENGLGEKDHFIGALNNAILYDNLHIARHILITVDDLDPNTFMETAIYTKSLPCALELLKFGADPEIIRNNPEVSGEMRDLIVHFENIKNLSELVNGTYVKTSLAGDLSLWPTS